MSFMMDGLLEGFVKRDDEGFVARIDPRARTTFPLLLAVSFMLSHSIFPQTLSISSLIVFVIVAGNARRFTRVLKTISPFAVLIFLFSLFSTAPIQAAVSALKFAGVMMSLFAVFMLLSPEEIELIMRWLRLPRNVVFLFSASVRFVPILISDLREVIDNQMSRGLKITKNPVSLAKGMESIMVPLTLTAVQRSEELADSMVIRGYGISEKSTSMYVLRAGWKDFVFLLVSAIAGCSLILINMI